MQTPPSSKPTLAERFKAMSLHLALSVVLLGIALYLVFVLWYPAPLHQAAGVTKVFLILLGVDVLLGPLLTFVVYKKDLPQLRMDLGIILILQLAAFVYGLSTVSQGRPVWLVFVVDDFELVRPVDIDHRQSSHFLPEYQTSLWVGPRWVVAQYATDPKLRESQRQDEMFDGISLAQRPETYVPLSTKSAQILIKGHALEELKKYNNANQVNTTLSQWPQATRWLPLKGVVLDMVVLLDAQARVLATVDLRPWQ